MIEFMLDHPSLMLIGQPSHKFRIVLQLELSTIFVVPYTSGIHGSVYSLMKRSRHSREVGLIAQEPIDPRVQVIIFTFVDFLIHIMYYLMLSLDCQVKVI
jgi:hypothetical protein